MSKKNRKLEIKKGQLLPEWNFIEFCNRDQANRFGWGRMDINYFFLRAAEKDNLIKPLFQEEGKVRQADGTIKDGIVNYYSPHQIYLLAELKHNILDEDGKLRAPDTVDWYKERPKEKRPRYISWGRGMSFWADNPKKREEDEDNLWVGAHLLSEYLHSFLELIHALEPLPYNNRAEDKRRNWGNASILEYDFKPLKSSGKKLLKLYGLNEKKLNILRQQVGQFAEMADPLAHWYYYIKRLPEWRKDLLTGDASIAQEIYRLYDLLTEVWEVIQNKKTEPIFEFLYKDFGASFHSPKAEYLHGEDIKAIKYSVQQFKKWKLKKDNKPFVQDDIKKGVAALEKEINDYEKRYGDRSFAGSIRWTQEEGNMTLEDLDEKTKWYVDNAFAQIKDAKLKEEIASAIEHRLYNLQRQLSQIFWDISKQFQEKESAAWQQVQNFGNQWWWQNNEKIKNLNRDEQLQLANTERRKIEKEAKTWKERSRIFHGTVSWYTGIVFCKVCREKPVRLHIENTNRNMWQVSQEIVCDDCMASHPEPRTMRGGEWKCENCGTLLHKFAIKNIISDLLINKAPANITLDYGRVSIRTRCPSRTCEHWNTKVMNWGWLP